MTCQHELLDTKGEIKTSSPPLMRCVGCKEWVVARGYCEECGRRDAVEWMTVQTSPALSTDEFVRATYEEGITAMQRETCRHCGHVQGLTRLV